jgi:F420-dependent NADP oxidoreductase-like protein
VNRGDHAAGSPAEAVRDADAVLLAVHWLRIADVLKQVGDLSGKAAPGLYRPKMCQNQKCQHDCHVRGGVSCHVV